MSANWFAMWIRQNELRVSYTVPAIPSEAAWMFHVMQVILVVIGFDTETNCPLKADGSPVSAESEGAAVQLQAMFFLNGALSTFCEKMKAGEAVFLDYPEYDPSHWVSNYFAYRSHPTSFLPIPVDDSLADSFEYNEAFVQWHECGMEVTVPGVCVFCNDHGTAAHPCEKAPRLTVRNLLDEADAAAKAAGLGPRVRVLASQISGEGMPGAININFFIKEEERARGESSHSSLPELVTPPPSSEY
ncbi:hypothetical protein DFH08DRAFT_819563 [Mycena albidolilacea]|uniref:Uncharacterized protein n=1 Tax=Mycena albidolilacea TaxID=1033008 RepID=A0AAD6ZFS5_9AGAR|nr:hypothetical protein DFH08DRAFT_819563 [Mycena albidolilacea]